MAENNLIGNLKKKFDNFVDGKGDEEGTEYEGESIDGQEEPDENVGDFSEPVKKNGKTTFVLCKPEARTEIFEIARNLMRRKVVLLNLEDLPKSEVRRCIDFLQGTIFALDGQMKKVSDSTYIFIPVGSDVNGEILEDVENFF